MDKTTKLIWCWIVGGVLGLGLTCWLDSILSEKITWSVILGVLNFGLVFPTFILNLLELKRKVIRNE